MIRDGSIINVGIRSFESLILIPPVRKQGYKLNYVSTDLEKHKAHEMSLKTASRTLGVAPATLNEIYEKAGIESLSDPTICTWIIRTVRILRFCSKTISNLLFLQ